VIKVQFANDLAGEVMDIAKAVMPRFITSWSDRAW